MNVWKRQKTDPAKWFSGEEVAKAKRYQKPLKRLKWIMGAVNFGLLLALISTGAFPKLVESVGVTAWPLQILVILAAFIVIFTIVGLPADVWREFRHEREWGFSTMTPATFLADQLKGIAIFVVLFTPLLIALWALIRTSDLWWVWGWAVFAGFSVVLGALAPVVIMPLFNKYKPMENQTLKERVLDLGRRVGVGISDVLVMDASKRTRKDNAFFTGMGSTKRVVVFDNLLERPEAEVEFVVAHELGHWRHRHVVRGVAAGLVLTFAVFGVLRLVSTWGAALEWAKVDGFADPASLPLFVLVFIGMGSLTAPLQAWLSRAFERQADLAALDLTEAPDIASDAMRNLATKNLGDLDPPWFDRIKASHPPVGERLEFIDAWTRTRAVA